MKSLEELEHAWKQAPPPPKMRGSVRTICVRKGGGVHDTPDDVAITVEQGVRGDTWTKLDDPERARQLTLMNATVANIVAHQATPAHDAGDNFLVDLDLSEPTLPVGTRLRLGEALVEITPEPHLGCQKFRARFGPSALKWVNQKETRAQRLRGVHARVLRPGSVAVGDVVEVVISDGPP